MALESPVNKRVRDAFRSPYAHLVSGELGTVLVESCRLQPMRAADVLAGLMLFHQRPDDCGGGKIVDAAGALVTSDEVETAAFTADHEGMDFGGSLCARAFAAIGKPVTKSDTTVKQRSVRARCGLNFINGF